MSEQRLPHAVMDLPSRRLKAVKIERLLGLKPELGPYRMLEVGTGSGGIAAYFGNHSSIKIEVTSVDVADSRSISEGYRFQLVTDTRLPFDDEQFDIVLSNHVIEHVGGNREQLEHLTELHRVLCRRGLGYLAVPNRWMLSEPHYRLAFLSWLPPSWRSPYLRLMRGKAFYDCKPLELGELEGMLEATGWQYENVGDEAASIMLQVEPGSLGLSIYCRRVPKGIRKRSQPLMPTLIYRIAKR